MSGPEMLIGALAKYAGIDPEYAKAQFIGILNGLPVFVKNLSAKLGELELRLKAIEEKQDKILALLDPPKYHALERTPLPSAENGVVHE